MISKIKNLTCLILPVVFVSLTGCQDSDLAEAARFAPSERLRVTPSAAINVGFLDEVVFDVSLEDAEGNPIVGAPVIASFVGDSANSSLEPATFNTSGRGAGRVTFIAPNQDASFAIRFKSPEDETSVDVTVDPALFSLILNIEYQGGREISSIQATLYDDLTCGEIMDTPEPSIRSYEKDASLPTSLFVDGLADKSIYTIVVQGKNENLRTRAIGCIDGISASQDFAPVVMADTPLDIAGQYNTKVRLEMDGVMDIIVDRFASSIEFAGSPERAILDGIGAVLAEDPFAGGMFNQQRAEQEMDLALAEFLSSEGMDVSESLEPAWEGMKSALLDLAMMGVMELEPHGEGELNVYHTLQRLRFHEGEEDELEFVVRFPDTGAGTALSEPLDTLNILSHRINLGLGDPFLFLFQTALNDNLGTPKIDEALLSIVDCSDVADFLEPKLVDITTRATIQQGCQAAASAAVDDLNTEVTELNRYDLLTFSGACDIEVPSEDEQVDEFDSDSFYVTWGNEASELYGMEASFEADRLVLQR